jgi:hypothetical protein
MVLHLRPVGGDLDSPELAAPADLDLGLDHAGVADRLRGGDRVVNCASRVAGRNRHAVAREQLLALVFEQVHDRFSLY